MFKQQFCIYHLYNLSLLQLRQQKLCSIKQQFIYCILEFTIFATEITYSNCQFCFVQCSIANQKCIEMCIKGQNQLKTVQNNLSSFQLNCCSFGMQCNCKVGECMCILQYVVYTACKSILSKLFYHWMCLIFSMDQNKFT